MFELKKVIIFRLKWSFMLLYRNTVTIPRSPFPNVGRLHL